MTGRTEDDLLLLSGSPLAEDGRADRARALVGEGLDWPYLIWRALRHDLLPRLAALLLDASPQAMPEELREQLADHTRRNAERNAFLAEELQRLAYGLRAAGIAAAPFDGPALVSSFGGDPVPRLHQAVKLLVRGRDLPASLAFLKARGYRWQGALMGAREETVPVTRTPYVLLSEDGRVRLELHWGIAPKHWDCPAEDLWNRLETVPLGRGEALTLPPDWHLLALAAQGSVERWRCLAWAFDLGELTHRRPDLEWDRALATARRYGGERMVLLGVEVARQVMDLPLPPVAEERLRAQPWARETARSLVQGCISANAAQPGLLARALFLTRLRDRVPDQARTALSVALTPTLSDCGLVPLPAWLSGLYYALRPLRLATVYAWLALGRARPVPFAPSRMEVVERMLRLAGVGPEDVVYDLGCGDGRIVVEAARSHGARAVGVDPDPDRMREALARAREAGVQDRVTLLQEDALRVDLSEATVVTLFMTAGWTERVLPKLRAELRPGARIVSHGADLPGWPPSETDLVIHADGLSRLYLWRV